MQSCRSFMYAQIVDSNTSHVEYEYVKDGEFL